jgi:hypothetical protein
MYLDVFLPARLKLTLEIITKVENKLKKNNDKEWKKEDCQKKL